MDRHVLADAIRALPAGTLVSLPRESLLEVLEGRHAGPAAAPDPGSSRLVDLTVAEVARLFGRAPSTIRQWLVARILEGYKLRGREWRVPAAALTALQERYRAPRLNDNSTATHHHGSLSDWRSLADRTNSDSPRRCPD